MHVIFSANNGFFDVKENYSYSILARNDEGLENANQVLFTQRFGKNIPYTRNPIPNLLG